jgi:hypothetical protein
MPTSRNVRLSYCYAVELRQTVLFPPWQYEKAIKGVSSCHPIYVNELRHAENLLIDYFKSGSSISEKPYNCLLLGPPGAGKTYVAQCIGKINKDVEVVEEVNLSLHSDAEEILRVIGAAKKRPRVVFLDEFDVTVDGSSAVRYLLDPTTSEQHARTVFIFSGSYLKNRHIFNTLCRNTTDFDLLRFLIDVFMTQKDARAADFVAQLHQLSGLYRETKQSVSPNNDLLDYLRQLHKIRDFLSRINGFIIQIPDISSPMSITDPMLPLVPSTSSGSEMVSLWPGKVFPEDVEQFVVDLGKPDRQGKEPLWKRYDTPDAPLLDYKNMILIERLGMVCNFLSKVKGKEGEDCLFISLKLLNYLVMVPLGHNVRSLKYLIEHCLKQAPLDTKKRRKEFDKNKCNKGCELQLKDDMRILYDMHLNKEPFFESPTELWRVLGVANGNPGAGSVFREDGDRLIRLPSIKEAKDDKEKREKEMTKRAELAKK